VKKTTSAAKKADEANENVDPAAPPKRALRGVKKSASVTNLASGGNQAENQEEIPVAKAPVVKAVRKRKANTTAELAPQPIAASTIIDFDTAGKHQADHVKLFQMSDSDMTSASGTTASNSMKSDEASSTRNTGQKQQQQTSSLSSSGRMTTRSSRSQLQRETSCTTNEEDASVSATATAIVNSANSTADNMPYVPAPQARAPALKSSMKKSTSTSKVTEAAPPLKGILVSNQPAPKTKILPPPVIQVTAEEATSKRPAAAAITNPNVNILAKIDANKPDQILNVKCDNKTKHTASTSTPSGMRRKPLKAPQDVSMIVKPE
jgi:hypothetical protein